MVRLVGAHPLTGELIVARAGPPLIERKAASPGAATLTDRAADGSRALQSIVVRFARLNVIDSDGDVTLSGAFPTKDLLLSAWQHGSWQPGQLPVGRGRIAEEGEFAVFRGHLFDTVAGKEHFATFKAAAELCRWSYGFNVLDASFGTFHGKSVRFLKRLDVHEVSAVLVPAGVDTGLLETSGLSPTNLMLAAAARDNELALAGLGKARSRIAAWAPDGRPIRVARSARSPRHATKEVA